MGVVETITLLGVALAIAEIPVLVGILIVVGLAALFVGMGIS